MTSRDAVQYMYRRDYAHVQVSYNECLIPATYGTFHAPSAKAVELSHHVHTPITHRKIAPRCPVNGASWSDKTSFPNTATRYTWLA